MKTNRKGLAVLNRWRCKGSIIWVTGLVTVLALLGSTNPPSASGADVNRDGQRWIGTWATAPQPLVTSHCSSAHVVQNQSNRKARPHKATGPMPDETTFISSPLPAPITA